MRAQRRGSRGSRGGPCVPSSGAASPSPVAGWVEPEWAVAPLCAEVRGLIGLAPGPELAAALAEVPMVQACPAGPRFHAGSALDAAVVFPEPPGSGQRAGASGDCDPCDAPAPSDPSGPSDPPAPSGPSGPPHPSGPDPSWGPVLGRGGRGFPVPGSAAGFPCCCQLLLAAAWEAQAAWTGVQAGRALLCAAGADPVAATPEGFAPARVLDRARDELSGVLRISPHSVSYRLRAARALEPQTTDGDSAEPDANPDDDAAADAGPDPEVDAGAAADAGPDGDADAGADANPSDDADSGAESGAVGSGLRVSALGALVDEGLLFSSGLRAITSAASELPAGVRVAVHDGMAGRIRQRRAGGRASWPAWELRRIALALALSLTPPPGDDPDGETQTKLDSGEYVAFDSVVRVYMDGVEISSNSLSGSIYASNDVRSFWTAHRDSNPMNRNCSIMRAACGCSFISHYFPDMVREAIDDARRFVRRAPRLRAA